MPRLASGGAGSYSTDHRMTTCGDGLQPEVLEFGFGASGLRVHNTCTDPVYFTLTTDPASTKCAFVAGCSALVLSGGLLTLGVSLLTTSTSTAGGVVARPRIAVNAWSD